VGFAALLDLYRQVSGILLPPHGGTGHDHGSEWLLARGLNSTGATIARRNIVQLTGATNAAKVSKVTATNSTHVLGVCVGYYDGQQLVEADCPDGYEMAIQIGGEAECLIESAVTRDEFAYSAATDGKITSSSTAGSGAFGRIVDSQDTSTGATFCRVVLGLPGSGSGAGAATYGTPALTLSTSNAAGAANSAIRTDATIAAFDATSPTTQAFGDSAATGSAGVAARRDHKHAMMANPVSYGTPAIVLGTAAAAGSSADVIRKDATIAAFDSTAPVTQAFGDNAATGSAAVAARRDHTHGMPSLGTGASDAAAGNHTHDASGFPARLLFSDLCNDSSLPSGASSSGDLAYDGSILRRELGGTQTSIYATPSFPFSDYGTLIFECEVENLNAPTNGAHTVRLVRDTGSTVMGRLESQSDVNNGIYDQTNVKIASGTTTGAANYVADSTEASYRKTISINRAKYVSFGQAPQGGIPADTGNTYQNNGRHSSIAASFVYSGTLNAGDNVHFEITVAGTTRKVGIYMVRVWRGAISPN